MIFSLRTHRPDEAVNDLSLAFDYAADVAAAQAATDMLEEAKTRLAQQENHVPESGVGPYPLVRAMAETELSRLVVMQLEGALAQANAAVATYPAAIAKKAYDRFGTER
jgi:hypothetical protein